MTMYLGDPHQDQKTLYFGLCINVSMWMQRCVCTMCVCVITPFWHLMSSKEKVLQHMVVHACAYQANTVS